MGHHLSFICLLSWGDNTESVSRLYIPSVPHDSMFVSSAPTFPLSSTIRFATAYLTSVFGHLMSLSGLSGDRGPGPVLRLASPAVAGATLCSAEAVAWHAAGRGGAHLPQFSGQVAYLFSYFSFFPWLQVWSSTRSTPESIAPFHCMYFGLSFPHLIRSHLLLPFMNFLQVSSFLLVLLILHLSFQFILLMLWGIFLDVLGWR